MAPGEILIQVIIPIASIAATALGAFVVKKRRDKKKLAAGERAGMLSRIEDLEQKLDTLTMSVLLCATEEKVDGEIRRATNKLRSDIAGWDETNRDTIEREIQSAADNLRTEIECVNNRVHDVYTKEQIERHMRENVPSKGEMERHVNEGCESVLRRFRREFQTLVDPDSIAMSSLRSDLEKKVLDAAEKIAADAESDVEVDMKDVRREINKKIQEYDLALTKWVKKKVEDHQPKMDGAVAFNDKINIPQHGVAVEPSDATALVDEEPDYDYDEDTDI